MRQAGLPGACRISVPQIGPSIKADQMTQANQLAPIAETDCNDKEDKLTSFGSSLALRSCGGRCFGGDHGGLWRSC
ncbi:hypothetical protein ABBQ38_007351 [Trebouxia sp. C0009 RCD-2024]